MEEGESELDPLTLAMCEVADAVRELTRAVRENGGDPQEDETLD